MSFKSYLVHHFLKLNTKKNLYSEEKTKVYHVGLFRIQSMIRKLFFPSKNS